MQPDNVQPTTVAWNQDDRLEVLVFDLGGQSFALEAVLVREILDMMPETRVPGAPPLVSHVVNFRGRIIPLANLHLAFGMEVAAMTPDSRIVVIEIDLDGQPTMIGLRTDKVHEVATFDAASSEAAPVVGMRWRRDHVRALVRHGDDIVVLPDLEAVFLFIAQGKTAGAAIH
ncbi:chemotaxis protein CheW [Sphingomonas sp. Leaf10]|uniref:chemotaxis protein CheW n=1 Tax=Sphingomonas sp. Leaf10 TaxID=1735676 RepID=UPI0006F7F825|nr:chemotaxis protein CheW [Sphingomonas sp. Leaf10]KQM40799.1 chemotaxis protein CheW [Sphingomonas sp. Leaf10]